MNWDEELRKHRQKIEKEERENEERKRRRQKITRKKKGRRAAEKNEDFKTDTKEREKGKFCSEEEKRKGLELKWVKENLWRWRKKQKR